MDRRAFLGALTGGLLAAPLAAKAQPPSTISSWKRTGDLEAHQLRRAWSTGVNEVSSPQAIMATTPSTDGGRSVE